MASVDDRWHVKERATGAKIRSSRYGTGKRWQVRYRDPEVESSRVVYEQPR